jgi:hypothetical protein
MGVGRKTKWILTAAVLLAAALATIYFFEKEEGDGRSSSRDELSSGGEITSSPSDPGSRDIILAEVDGVVVWVQLPDGGRETGILPSLPPAEVRSQSYQGLDPRLQQPGGPFLWFERTEGAWIYGRAVSVDGRDTAPVYRCDTGVKACEKTEEVPIDAVSGEIPVVPQGALSPSGKRLVLVNLHDTPYLETGARWELLLFDTDRLSAVTQAIDISSVADVNPDAGYDNVSAVAWEPSEERLAVATSRRIVIVDLRSGVLTTVYEVPDSAIDEDVISFDSSMLVWSPSGRYLAFADYSRSAAASEEEDEETTDTLRLIDLEQGNALLTLTQGKDVRLIPRD